MNIIHKRMHHIDFESEEVLDVPISSDDALEFINNVIKETLSNNSTRKYLTKSNNTEVISFINSMILCERNNDNIDSGEVAVAISIDDITRRISERLMESEVSAQLSIESMGRSLRKGSLIQALVNLENSYRYVLIKIDHSLYLDTKNLKKSIGLPLEEKILKSCVIDYNESNEITDINLYDSTKKMANYWWNGLLELKPASKDDINTKTAFRKINVLIDKEIGESCPADATMLINRSKGYFDSKSQFDIDDFINTVVGDYNSVKDESIFNENKSELKEKIKNLATKHFDGQFNIDIAVINKVKSNVYKIDDRISLTLNGKIEALRDKIVGEQEDGRWTLKISDVPEEIGKKFEF